jgi:hypothetical protein
MPLGVPDLQLLPVQENLLLSPVSSQRWGQSRQTPKQQVFDSLLPFSALAVGCQNTRNFPFEYEVPRAYGSSSNLDDSHRQELGTESGFEVGQPFTVVTSQSYFDPCPGDPGEGNLPNAARNQLHHYDTNMHIHRVNP